MKKRRRGKRLVVLCPLQKEIQLKLKVVIINRKKEVKGNVSTLEWWREWTRQDGGDISPTIKHICVASKLGLDVLSGTLEVLARIRARYQIARGEHVRRIDVVLDRLDHADAVLANRLLHPAASYLADAVVMRERAAAGDDLVARRRLDLVVQLDRIAEAVVVDGEVEVNACARVVDLGDARRRVDRILDAGRVARALQAHLHVAYELAHAVPRRRRLERLGYDVVVEAQVAQVGDRERQHVALLAVLFASRQSSDKQHNNCCYMHYESAQNENENAQLTRIAWLASKFCSRDWQRPLCCPVIVNVVVIFVVLNDFISKKGRLTK